MQHEGSEPRDGILVASGYGLKIYVERGHLIIHDGVGRDRRTLQLSRATSGLERLVVIGHTGFVTLEALRWIRDIGASFAQIGSDGEVIAISSVDRFHNTKLRRAQAVAADTGHGLKAMRHLAAAKLEQQMARVVAMPDLWPPKPNGGKGQVEVGSVIRRELEKLNSCTTLTRLRACESVAGRWYWQTLAGLPLTFDTSWRSAVPDHWRTAGARTSPPSGFKSSRKAATPFHALINYAYAILETEATITLQAHGFDPGMGILHTDKRYRGSLAHDLMEPLRPVVDGLGIGLVKTPPALAWRRLRDARGRMPARTSYGTQARAMVASASPRPREPCRSACLSRDRRSDYAPRATSQRDDCWQGKQATTSGTGERLSYEQLAGFPLWRKAALKPRPLGCKGSSSVGSPRHTSLRHSLWRARRRPAGSQRGVIRVANSR